MARFAIRTLEFDKVKEMLAAKAATSLGKAAIIAQQIESDFKKVNRLQEETAEALRIMEGSKRFPFGGAFNITAELKRAELGGVLEPLELQHIQTTAEAIRVMKAFLAENTELAPVLADFGERMQIFSRLEKQIASVIDEHGDIKDTASPKLHGLRNAIVVAKNRVKEKLDSILTDPNNQKYFMDKLVTMRGDRYVIPIKQEYKMNFPGVVHDQSSTGATLFIEPMAVLNLNNDIKRYMVEDMGYSDPGSQAALNNYTDIDFNDIVIDFDQATTQTYKITTTTIAGVPTVKREKQGDPKISTTAKIRALGGTWDFKFFVDGKQVFQKSEAATSDVEFNTANYPFFKTQTTPSIEWNRMYNTARKSDMRGDGCYETTGDASWICELKSTNLNAWDPATNNISFVIVENDTDISDWHMDGYFDSKTDNGNVYRLNFPAKGACPKIVAFDLTKPWQKEKVHVNTNWFKSDTSTIDQKLAQNTK